MSLIYFGLYRKAIVYEKNKEYNLASGSILSINGGGDVTVRQIVVMRHSFSQNKEFVTSKDKLL